MDDLILILLDIVREITFFWIFLPWQRIIVSKQFKNDDEVTIIDNCRQTVDKKQHFPVFSHSSKGFDSLSRQFKNND